MIYFQVLDRTIRNYLNELMPRFPFAAAAGETPPGLTDFLIFYDPLVHPTRPGHILPAEFLSYLESGREKDAEKLLIGMILAAAESATVEFDGEIQMLTIEEEEHRARLREIERRRKQLDELCDRFSGAVPALREWVPAEPAPAEDDASDVDAPSPAAAVSESPEPPEESSFYELMAPKFREVMEKSEGVLSAALIDEPFHLAVDLGLSPSVSGAELRRAGILPASRDGTNAGQTDSRVLYVTDYLIRKFSETYQISKIEEMEKALAAIRATLEELGGRIARLKQKRREIVLSSGVNLGTDLTRLDQIQYRSFAMASAQRSSPISPDDKRALEKLEDEREYIEKRLDWEIHLRFSSSPEFQSSFRRLNQALAQSLQEQVRLEEDEAKKSGVLSSLSEAFRRSAPDERCRVVEEQINRLAQFQKLLCTRGRRRTFSPVSAAPWPVKPSAVSAALDKIQSADATLFPEKFLRRRGPPGVLLVPSFGSGLYDWRDGLLVISLYPDKLETAILAALAEFRLDADESKDLFQSYGQIKKYKGIGFARLKELFIADYTAWIEKEASGFRVMEKDVRLWFERKIPLDIPR